MDVGKVGEADVDDVVVAIVVLRDVVETVVKDAFVVAGKAVTSVFPVVVAFSEAGGDDAEFAEGGDGFVVVVVVDVVVDVALDVAAAAVVLVILFFDPCVVCGVVTGFVLFSGGGES